MNYENVIKTVSRRRNENFLFFLRQHRIRFIVWLLLQHLNDDAHLIVRHSHYDVRWASLWSIREMTYHLMTGAEKFAKRKPIQLMMLFVVVDARGARQRWMPEFRIRLAWAVSGETLYTVEVIIVSDAFRTLTMNYTLLPKPQQQRPQLAIASLTRMLMRRACAIQSVQLTTITLVWHRNHEIDQRDEVKCTAIRYV